MATTSNRISAIDQPGLAVRAFYKIGARMFGQVPTPERIMAHRIPLMLGIGGLWTAIEWSARLSAELRALVQLHVARLSQAAY